MSLPFRLSDADMKRFGFRIEDKMIVESRNLWHHMN